MIGYVRGRLRAAKADGGFTLVELLVVISISLVVLMGATAMMITTQKFSRGASARSSNTMEAAIAMQTISHYLQSTTAICGADSNPVEDTCEHMASGVKDNGEIVYGSTYKDMWFFTNWDSIDQGGLALPTGGIGAITVATRAPWRVHVYVASNGDLKVDLYKGSGDMSGSCCTWASTPQTKILAHNVVVTAPSGSNPGTPFSYWTHPTPKTFPLVVTQVPTTWPNQTGVTGSTVDQVNLDIVVAHASNPVVPPTEVKDSIPLANRLHDQDEWRTFP